VLYSRHRSGVGRGEYVVKNLLAVAVLSVVGTLGAGPAVAQDPPASLEAQHVISSEELELLRADIRSQKKQLIARNLKLTDDESTKFWPVYDQFAADLTKINDRKFGLLQQYADTYATLSDDQAVTMLKQWLAVETEINQLRERYIPIVAKVLSGKNAASFFQLERRAAMLVDLQLSAKTPLAQGKK
jgi:hypothetical protein